MIASLQDLYQKYPRQFWLMFVGMLISTIGTSMIWPFLLVYVSKRLAYPLTAIASLLTLNSVTGLIASFGGGWVVDRLGRKWIMAFGLVLNGFAYLFMGNANTFGQFAVLLAFSGLANPLYRVSADAMMADLVPPEKRIDAYALFRLSNNLGIAIGPAIGGFVAASSYSLAFYCAAVGMTAYSLLLVFFARETLPTRDAIQKAGLGDEHPKSEPLAGYLSILTDFPYVGFIVSFTIVSMCASLVWVLLPVYTSENYGLPMQLYGFLPTTNAIMVVTLQILVTRFTKRFPPLPVVAAGAFLYTVSVGAVGLMSGFWGFWICMVVMTFGELTIVPTSSTYVANRAPIDKRGRYMSLYALTWGVASGVAPVFGGILNDNFGPHYIWLGGAVAGALAVTAFLMLARSAHEQTSQAAATISPSNS